MAVRYSPQLDRIEAHIKAVTKRLSILERIMATLNELLADVRDERTKEDSLVALLNSIKAQLDAALAGALTPEQQAQVDAVFAQVEDNKTAVQAAIDANTPKP